METKLKIGDVIQNISYINCIHKIIDIVFEKTEYKNNGFFGQVLENCYILLTDKSETSYLPFRSEKHYLLFESSKLETKIISSCPNCNGELVDKYSEWAGKDIKKCKLCGWC